MKIQIILMALVSSMVFASGVPDVQTISSEDTSIGREIWWAIGQDPLALPKATAEKSILEDTLKVAK